VAPGRHDLGLVGQHGGQNAGDVLVHRKVLHRAVATGELADQAWS
jgi:hypothetical protein